MGRTSLAALVMMCMALSVSAQDGLRSASLPDRTPPPLPSDRPDLFLSTPDTYRPHLPSPQSRPGDGFALGPGFFAPWPWWPDYVASTERPPRRIANGYLQLQVSPATAEVYVDGLYVGSVNDVRQMVPGYPLDQGPHRVELRAPGYLPRIVDVRIDPNDARIYRSELDPSLPAAPPVARVTAAAPPKTFYVIPGCYAGDKRPQANRLPRGCNVSATRTVPPR